jgi:hypothetical protein
VRVAKGFMVRARMSPAEYQAVKNAAHKSDLDVSKWARKVMLLSALKSA